MERNGEFKYKVCGLDRVVDEKGGAFIALRKIAWNVGPEDEVDESKVKLDLRKYYTTPEGEKMNKGVSFLTEEGPSELVHTLLEEGYGDSGKCLMIIKDRSDYKQAITFAYGLENEDDADDFFDPRKLLDELDD